MNTIETQTDTRTWNRQKRFDEYLKLCKHEPELRHLYRWARLLGRAVKDNHARDEIWYTILRHRVVDLVGFGALMARDKSLTTMRAYDVAYQTLIDVLYDPDLFASCKEPDVDLRCITMSAIAEGPHVTTRRQGDDLVVTNWFNESAIY